MLFASALNFDCMRNQVTIKEAIMIQNTKFGPFPKLFINWNVHWKKLPSPLKTSVIFIVQVFDSTGSQKESYGQKYKLISNFIKNSMYF